jgi:hypothetical protein
LYLGLTFDNCIDRAAFLAETAVDTLGHVDVISRCPSASIFPLLGFYGDSLCRTYLRIRIRNAIGRAYPNKVDLRLRTAYKQCIVLHRKGIAVEHVHL